MAIVIPWPKREASLPAPKPMPASPKTEHRAWFGTDSEDARKNMLGKVHIALTGFYKDLEGFNEGVYRFLLEEKFGTSSAAELNCQQLHELLTHFAEMGFRARRKHSVRRGTAHKKEAPAALTMDKSGLNREKLLSMIEALLTAKGEFEETDVPWGYALAILKKQTGGVIKSLDHADIKQVRAVMVALKRDAIRRGYYRN